MKKIAKIGGLTLIFLSLLVGGWIFFQGNQTDQGGNLIDDRERDIPFFRVMSDVDTSTIDPKIKTWSHDILGNKKAYKTMGDKDYALRMKEICTYYDDICDRLKMETEFTFRELYTFTVFSVFIITEVDANIQLEGVGGLRTTLSSIMFDKSNIDITRGKAGHRNVLINTYDMRDLVELFEILTHELMHILDLGVLDDPHGEKNKQYKEFGDISFGANDWSLKFYSISWQQEHTKRNSTREKNIISKYGATNTFEEFAEFGNAWINHQVPLIAMAREDEVLLKKYLLFQQLFGNRYINKDIDTYRTKDLTQRPYDTSRRHDTVDDIDHAH